MQIAPYRRRAQRAVPDGVGDLSAVGQRALASVAPEAAAPEGVWIGFAHIRRVAADQVEMCAGFQPLTMNKRFDRIGGARYHVG